MALPSGLPQVSDLVSLLNQSKNHIINGNFDFWQRNITNTFSVSTSQSLGFTADRFNSYVATTLGGGVANFTLSRSTNVPTIIQSGFQSLYSLQILNNTATAASVALNNALYPIFYRIEGLDFAKFQGRRSLFAFWFQSSVVGTYTVSFRGITANRAYVSSFTVTAASTWQQVVIPITFETGWTTLDNQSALEIFIAPLAGSHAQTSSLNAWQTGTNVMATGSVNWAATAGATLRVAQIQLLDTSLPSTSTVPSFSRAGNTIGSELRLCQRYYEKGGFNTDQVIGAGGVIAAPAPDILGNFYNYNEFKVEKRGAPAIAAYQSSTGATHTVRNANGGGTISVTYSAISTTGFTVQGPLPAGATLVQYGWTADAEL